MKKERIQLMVCAVVFWIAGYLSANHGHGKPKEGLSELKLKVAYGSGYLAGMSNAWESSRLVMMGASSADAGWQAAARFERDVQAFSNPGIDQGSTESRPTGLEGRR